MHIATRSAAVLAVIAAIISACGANHVRRHSIAAQTLEDIAVEARRITLEVREDSLRRAGMEAVARGEDPEPAIVKAAKEFDDGPLVNATNAFISAKHTYVLTALAISGRGSPSELADLAKNVLLTYDSLRKVLLTFGHRLPPLPEPLVDLLG